jgi:glycosyltransferase involved in cell wall biosynthesis
MKGKIFIYTPFSGSFYDKYLLNLVDNLNYNETIIGSPHDLKIQFPTNIKVIKFDEFSYWSKAGDYKELHSLIDFLDTQNIYRLHILRYSHENLFSILVNHPKIHNFKVSIGIFGHREIIETGTRLNLFDKLTNSNLISSILIHSISKNVVPPELVKYSHNLKVHFVSDPIYDNIEDYNLVNYVSENIKLLYFGTFFFGKGVDILIDALDHIKIDNFELTIAGDASTANFDISNIEFNDKVNFINKYLSEKDVVALFQNSNVIVLPYRSTYQFDTSGVLVQAALSKRLIIVPDIFPFNEVVNKYSLGLTFEPNCSESLSKSIVQLVTNYDQFYSKANFSEFVENISTWEEMSNLI